MRGPSPRIDCDGGVGMFLIASTIVGCLDALLTARGEGLSGKLSQDVVKMVLHRGAMEGVNNSGSAIFDFKRRQSAGSFVDSSVLRYLSARARSRCGGKSIDGFAHWSSLSSRK